MIQVTPTFTIDDDEFTERMVKASGPGGQHVKTVHSNSRQPASRPLKTPINTFSVGF